MERKFKPELRRLNRIMSRVQNIQTGRLDKVATPTLFIDQLQRAAIVRAVPRGGGLQARGRPRNAQVGPCG